VNKNPLGKEGVVVIVPGTPDVTSRSEEINKSWSRTRSFIESCSAECC
jgi:hypothetical protein